MAPWQVAVGFSIVLLVPLGAVVVYDLSYLSGYWGLVSVGRYAPAMRNSA